MRSYNDTPGDIPSLWSHIYIVNSLERNESFLMWNGAEKARCLDYWVALIAGFLLGCGFKVEGCIAAQGEEAGDVWSMTFYNGQFDTYRGWMKPTYEKESAAAEQSSRKEAVSRDVCLTAGEDDHRLGQEWHERAVLWGRRAAAQDVVGQWHLKGEGEKA